MFGAPKSTFGAPASSAFGQTTNTLFGSATKPTNLFGQPSVGLGGGGTTSLFGGGTTQQNTITWGTGATMGVTASNGTAIAFNPPVTPDTIQRGGQQTQVNAKHMCITAMKEYQDKSLEELRLEDYVLNRRSGNALATATTGTSLFGTSATVKPFQFGASQTTTTASSIFGQANKPTSSLFGGSGLSFGASSTTTQPVFGQPAQTQGSLLGVKPQFGATQQPTNLFGTAAPAQTSGFTFGQTAQTNSPFGTKPLFGGTTSGVSGGTGLFGTAQQPSTGTTGFTFGQPQATGLGGTTNLFGQTATSTAATGGQLNLFGAQPSSSSVLPFGSTQQTTNLFGAVKTTGAAPLFGTPSTALGTTQQTGFGAFGGLKPGGTTSLFGAATSTATSKPGGIFGIGGASNTSTGFGFGAATASGQTPAFGAFGAGTSTTGLFGQTNANTLAAKKPFEFGSSLTNPTVSSSTGLFGFGQTTSQAGGLFGGAGIGSTALGLGSAAGGTGTLFGQATGFGSLQKPAAPGFGPGFGLGGATGLGAGGLFGTTSTALGSLSSAAQPLGSGFGGIGTLQPSSITGGLTGLSNTTAEQFAQNIRAQQQVLDLVRSMPYGQSSLFRYLNMPAASETGTEDVEKQCASTESGSGAIVPARAAASALAQQHKAAGLTLGTGSPSSLVAGIVGRGTRLRQPSFTQRILKVSNRSKLFSGFYEDDAFLSPSGQNVSPALRLRRSSTLSDGTSLFGSPDPSNKGSFFVRRDDWKRLHLPESVRTSILERSAVSSQAFTEVAENSLNGDHTSEAPPTEISDPAEHRFGARAAGDSTPNINTSRSTSVPHTTTPLTHSTDSRRSESHTAGAAKLSVPFQRGLGMARAREALQTATAEDSVVLDDLETTWTSPVDMTNSEQWILNATAKSPVTSPKPKCGDSEPRAPSSTTKNSKAVLKLTKPGYYTLPTLEELEALVDSEGQCVVEDFVVGRRHYGHILFPGNTEVTDLDLDSIVHIRRREVVVYPDDEKKPPIGCGLNKRAEICLESIWPTDKATREPIKSPERLGLMRFEERLERATRRMDARFIEYRPESGSWVFEVKHFSKYRLEDSDNEDVDVFVPKTTTTESPQVDSKLPRSKDEYIKTTVLQPRTTATTTPQLKAVGALITEADSDMRFSPTHFGSFAFKDTTGLGLKTMELTDLTPDTTTIQEDDARSVSASVKQMRDAFFSPVFLPKVQPGRASSVLYRHGTGELSDEADEFEAAEYSAVWPIAGIKRFQASQSPELPPQDSDMAWVGQAGDNSQFCPASKMLSRTQITTATIPSKRERLSDDSDESAISDEPLTSRASFRPIPYEPFSDGVPLSTAAVPPITSGLHLARIPAQLKSVNGLFSGVGSELKPWVYPYFELSKCISDQTMAQSVKTPSQTRSIATKLFSSMLIDVGLNRGHGFRPCWGQIRFRELHTVVLTTVASAVRGSGAFTVSFSSLPSLIVQDDEDLLNSAMSTSECTTLSGSSADPALQPPVDHCPQWQPVLGLKPLEAYASTLQCAFPQMFEPSEELKKPRTLVLCRLISLCMALWGRHPQEVALHTVVGGKFQKSDKDGTSETSECELTPEQLVPDNLESATEDDAENQLSEDNPPQDHTESRYILQLARKQTLSEWIRAQSFPWLKHLLISLGLFDSVKEPHTVSSNSLAKSVPIDRIARGIFACLVAGEPGAGCRLALSAGMPELATLVAQSSSGDPIVRRGLQHQLLAWHQTEYDGCIPLELLRIYSLLAGQPRIPHPKVHDAFIDVLEQLDWIRVFGAHLWYLTDYTADLAEVLRIYSAFWHSINSTCASAKLSRPTPPHQRDLLSPPKAPFIPTDFPAFLDKDDTLGFRNWPRDSAYHLIQLFCHKTHSLERTLDPCSISRFEPSTAVEPTCRPSPDSLLDWSASWHLWRTLHALGYRHFSSPSSVSRICGEFASQLEDAGLWEWAIFVLLHLPDQTMRDACVKAVVSRHASLVVPTEQTGVAEEESPEYGRFLGCVSRLLNSFKLAPPPSLTRAEQFVVKLGVPSRWIYEAKAILARQRFNECSRGFTPDQLVLNSRNAADYAGLRLRARLFALLETAHWFAAGYYGEAQKVCVEYLLPDIVLHTNLSIACGCVGPSVGTGLFLSVTRLGHQLNRLLSPYRTLSTGHLPCRFEEGVGVYLRYSDILCLADELATLYQSRSNTQAPDADQSDENNQVDESESRARLALVLSNLNTELDTFMEQLHLMDTPNLNSRVVKIEIAVTCAKMISAFLSGLDPQSDMLVHLRRHLMSLVKINLPADYRLQELSTLSEAELSLGTF